MGKQVKNKPDKSQHVLKIGVDGKKVVEKNSKIS